VNRLETARLILIQLDVDALDAWLARDAARLEQLISARFREPVDAPPLFDEDLQRIRDDVAERGGEPPWLFLLRDTREPVGAGGVSPAGDGVVLLGYTIWPQHQLQGYASEAARALCEHGFSRHRARAIRATIPVGHAASERVAIASGMVRVGDGYEEGVGQLGIWEIRDTLRPRS
jgi:RimJ/RimL family protein N-acetyltransferase